MFRFTQLFPKKMFQNGPPDLDQIIDNMARKIREFLSGRPSENPSSRKQQWDNSNGDNSNGDNSNGDNSNRNGSGGNGSGNQISLLQGQWLLYGAGALVILWVILGFYIVDEKERAAILRFGKFQEITDPGIHWAPLFIDSAYKVNIKQVRSTSYRSTLLTGDENIIQITYEVQYIVSDPYNFLFKVRSPEEVLGQVVNSTFREVVGQNKLDFILLEGRTAVAQEAQERAGEILREYEIGLSLQTINFQEAQPPEQVQNAFDDANKAREDKQRYINEAEAYANGVVPVARGDAQKIIEEANSYRAKVVAKADGDTSRFLQVLKEYKQAPKVTEKRLWYETLQDVYSRNVKVYVSNPNSNQLLYLPLDVIKKKLGGKTVVGPAEHASPSLTPQSANQLRDTSRGRSTP